MTVKKLWYVMCRAVTVMVPCPSILIGWAFWLISRYAICWVDFVNAVPCAVIFHTHTKSALLLRTYFLRLGNFPGDFARYIDSCNYSIRNQEYMLSPGHMETNNTHSIGEKVVSVFCCKTKCQWKNRQKTAVFDMTKPLRATDIITITVWFTLY
jgi:hypothetical protein